MSEWALAIPDASAVEQGVIAKLLGDSTLIGLMPNGVYVDVAKPGAKRFVIVSLVEHNDVDVFGGRALEELTILVKAVALASTGNDVRQAAARIDELLESADDLEIEGYELMHIRRVSRVRITEVDEVDPDIRWFHRGARYEIKVALDRRPKIVAIYPASGFTATTDQSIGFGLWFDQPLNVAGGLAALANVTLTARSSNTGTHADVTLTLSSFSEFHSDGEFGFGQLNFQADGVDLTGCEGITFTIDAASDVTGWQLVTGPLRETIEGALVDHSSTLTIP